MLPSSGAAEAEAALLVTVVDPALVYERAVCPVCKRTVVVRYERSEGIVVVVRHKRPGEGSWKRRPWCSASGGRFAGMVAS